MSIPDDEVGRNPDLPPAGELWGRIQTARSVLSHRFDPADRDVDLLARVLAGESLSSLIEHG